MNSIKLLDFISILDNDTNIIICNHVFIDTWLGLRECDKTYDDYIVFKGKFNDFHAKDLINIIDSVIVQVSMIDYNNQKYVALSIRNDQKEDK